MKMKAGPPEGDEILWWINTQALAQQMEDFDYKCW